MGDCVRTVRVIQLNIHKEMVIIMTIRQFGNDILFFFSPLKFILNLIRIGTYNLVMSSQIPPLAPMFGVERSILRGSCVLALTPIRKLSTIVANPYLD